MADSVRTGYINQDRPAAQAPGERLSSKGGGRKESMIEKMEKGKWETGMEQDSRPMQGMFLLIDRRNDPGMKGWVDELAGAASMIG